MKTLTVRILPILLVLCMLLASCGPAKECAHTNTELRNTIAASCTAEGYTGDLVCRDCGVTVAAGTPTAMNAHVWGDWTVTKEATATEAGTKTHTCGVCGAMASEAIPALGVPEDTVMDSYSELIESVYINLLGEENGTLSFVAGSGPMSVEVNMTVCKENGIYLAWFEYVLTDGEDVETISALYRDGILAACEMDGKEIEIYDFDAGVDASFADFTAVLNKACALVNDTAESYLTQFRTELQKFVEENGARIEALMTSLDLEMKATDLMLYADFLDTAYATLAKELGIETEIKAVEGVTLPTVDDYLKAFEGIINVTENGNGKTYSFDAVPTLNAVKAYVEALEAVCEMTLADYIYSMLAPNMDQINPEVTDWATLEAHIRATITGDMTCGFFIDQMIQFVQDSGAFTMEELYAMINAYVTEESGEAFDIEEVLNEYRDMTLDELVAMLFQDETMTLTALYDLISELLTTMHVGEITITLPAGGSADEELPPPQHESTVPNPPVEEEKNDMTSSEKSAPEGEKKEETDQAPEEDIPSTEEPPVEENMITLAEIVAMAKGYVNMFAVDAMGFTLAVNADGKITSFVIEGDVSMIVDGQKAPIVDLKLELKQDPNAKVTIPEHLNAATSNKISQTYDANGNLVISGLNTKAEYEFELSAPYVDFPIEEIVEKDAQMSANYGLEIYVTKEGYWGDNGYSFQYLVAKDGTCYTFNHEWDENTGDVYLVIGEKIENTDNMFDPSMGKPVTDKVALEYDVYDANGNDVTASYANMMEVTILMPSYFAKVDGRYINLYEIKDENGFEQMNLETMKLTSGSTMYIKGKADFGETVYVYGYLPISATNCVWVACKYENDELVEELYNGEISTWAVDSEIIYDVNEYLTKNADGSYTISAALFAELRNIFVENFDCFSVSVDGSYTEGDVSYNYHYVVGAYNVIGEDLPLFGGATAEKMEFDWYFWFMTE